MWTASIYTNACAYTLLKWGSSFTYTFTHLHAWAQGHQVRKQLRFSLLHRVSCRAVGVRLSKELSVHALAGHSAMGGIDFHLTHPSSCHRQVGKTRPFQIQLQAESLDQSCNKVVDVTGQVCRRPASFQNIYLASFSVCPFKQKSAPEASQPDTSKAQSPSTRQTVTAFCPFRRGPFPDKHLMASGVKGVEQHSSSSMVIYPQPRLHKVTSAVFKSTQKGVQSLRGSYPSRSPLNSPAMKQLAIWRKQTVWNEYATLWKRVQITSQKSSQLHSDSHDFS